ncbi:hypothetical protein CTI12_AA081680 [Artemisia annua]|uniref:Uncharacterized protein n=1 Tax=Artemisia annua TaxID=35608 RepID=A0A2U1Q297_ARTAN|nr:hypothetical protein CTI12_AA081680 [Artemisia annua]
MINLSGDHEVKEIRTNKGYTSLVPTSLVAINAAIHRRTHRRIDACRWSFLLSIIQYWRSQEGAPNTKELGECSSSATSRTLLVTGEPLHHTVPLLAARLVRHEDRLDDIVDILDDFPREQIENLADEVENLVIGQLSMETVFGQVGTRLENAIRTITRLVDTITSMQTVIETLDSELERVSSQDLVLVRPIGKAT